MRNKAQSKGALDERALSERGISFSETVKDDIDLFWDRLDHCDSTEECNNCKAVLEASRFVEGLLDIQDIISEENLVSFDALFHSIRS